MGESPYAQVEGWPQSRGQKAEYMTQVCAGGRVPLLPSDFWKQVRQL